MASWDRTRLRLGFVGSLLQYEGVKRNDGAGSLYRIVVTMGCHQLSDHMISTIHSNLDILSITSKRSHTK